MANKRMFNMKICDSDAFLDMPLSAQALYFHLNMRADDDGFVGNPRRIQRTIGANGDDLKLLITKRFVLVFEDGVIVIKHWKMHNCIQKDRYNPTVYQDEMKMLYEKSNKSYTLDASKAKCIQNDSKTIPQMETKCIQNDSTDSDIDIDIDIDKESDLDLDLEKENISCSEPKKASEPNHETEPPIITLTLNTKEEYPIFQKDLCEWQELYPAVDIIQELRKMKGWCKDNPQKRKTKNGIRRFIGSWLSREQDKGGVFRNQSNNTYQSREEQIANRVSVVDTWGFPEENSSDPFAVQ